MRQIILCSTRGNMGQMTWNAIELQVPTEHPLALFCLDLCKLDIHTRAM